MFVSTSENGMESFKPNKLLSVDIQNATGVVLERINRHPFTTHILQESLTTAHYHQFITDLKIIYLTFAQGFSHNRGTSELNKLYFPDLKLHDAIEQDLKSRTFTLLPAIEPSEVSQRYVDHLNKCASENPILLIAHFSVRYLNDLSFGVEVEPQAERKWPDALNFFRSKLPPSYKNVGEFINFYERKLNKVQVTDETHYKIVSEALHAVNFTEKMFDAIISSTPKYA